MVIRVCVWWFGCVDIDRCGRARKEAHTGGARRRSTSRSRACAHTFSPTRHPKNRTSPTDPKPTSTETRPPKTTSNPPLQLCQLVEVRGEERAAAGVVPPGEARGDGPGDAEAVGGGGAAVMGFGVLCLGEEGSVR